MRRQLRVLSVFLANLHCSRVAPCWVQAFYKWIQDGFQADACVHVGMHGTVEWCGHLSMYASDTVLGPRTSVWVESLGTLKVCVWDLLAKRLAFCYVYVFWRILHPQRWFPGCCLLARLQQSWHLRSWLPVELTRGGCLQAARRPAGQHGPQVCAPPQHQGSDEVDKTESRNFYEHGQNGQIRIHMQRFFCHRCPVFRSYMGTV